MLDIEFSLLFDGGGGVRESYTLNVLFNLCKYEQKTFLSGVAIAYET